MTPPESLTLLPINKDQKQIVENLFQSFNNAQLTWLAGYLTGISLPDSLKIAAPEQSPGINHNLPSVSKEIEKIELTIIYGSRTGNGAGIAKKLKAKAEQDGFNVHIYDTNDYAINKLKNEKNILVIVSTHGDGVPPSAAEEFYNFLFGKRAPELPNTNFSVLALGDSSYKKFCKAGRDIDSRLEALGAKRIFPRTDCDVEFETPSDAWIEGTLAEFRKKYSSSVSSPGNVSPDPVISEIHQEQSVFNRKKPFRARLLDKILLNGKGSQKETWHYEISLEGSNLSYQPGDALGVYPVNPPSVVTELLNILGVSGSDRVLFENENMTLEILFSKKLEIANLTAKVLELYNETARNEALTDLLKNPEKTEEYIYGRDVVDLLQDYPAENITVEFLTKILRKLQPRLYSISSSPLAHPGEVHITVASVRYTQNRYKEGVCSTFLADRLGEEEYFEIFIEKNPDFRLPENGETPVIMVGPGTGVAPFRAFLEHRDFNGDSGKNWLFFGDQRFTTDFLYQTEWQSLQRKGVLQKLNVAFSRDEAAKIYVQHKMLENQKELYEWLKNGAHFYVCGDMKKMWNDVHNTLLEIISTEGGISKDKAEEYLREMKKAKRYQTDVY